MQEPQKALHRGCAEDADVEKVDPLYRLVLFADATQAETTRLSKYIDQGGATGDVRDAVADVFWALLTSAEFMLNH